MDVPIGLHPDEGDPHSDEGSVVPLACARQSLGCKNDVESIASTSRGGGKDLYGLYPPGSLCCSCRMKRRRRFQENPTTDPDAQAAAHGGACRKARPDATTQLSAAACMLPQAGAVASGPRPVINPNNDVVYSYSSCLACSLFSLV